MGEDGAADDAEAAGLARNRRGIDGDGVQSGVYMWNYMANIKGKFHIFVALNNNVNGTQAYGSLMETLRLLARGCRKRFVMRWAS
jgi:hypothetical protein